MQNKEHVSPDVLKNLNHRLYTAAAGGGKVEVENSGRGFLEAVLGNPVPDDSPLLPKLRNKLKKERIEGAAFRLDPEKVKPPRVRRILTKNGITIRVPMQFRDLVREDGPRIIIEDKFQAEFDETDGSGRQD